MIEIRYSSERGHADVAHEAQVNGQALGAGDAMKISGERKVRIDRARDAEVLLFDLN